MHAAKDVDGYIHDAPPEVRARLRDLRAVVREAAPEAMESISYGMPFYSFRGESGIAARLCYFAFQKKGIVFYTRPGFLEGLSDEVDPYRRTKSSLHFRPDRAIPVRLVKRILRSGIRLHAAANADEGT